MTTGELIKYLSAFPKDTKVVMGQMNSDEVIEECHANTYYPPHLDLTVWVVIDAGERYKVTTDTR